MLLELTWVLCYDFLSPYSKFCHLSGYLNKCSANHVSDIPLTSLVWGFAWQRLVSQWGLVQLWE